MGSTTSILNAGLGLTNTLSPGRFANLGTIVGFVDNIVQDRESNDLAVKQLKQQQKLQEQQLQQDQEIERQKIDLQAAQDEEDRQRALRRAVASQRASFGEQGVGSSGGSSEAVLLGLFEETDDERRQREGLDNLKEKALQNQASDLRSINLLQSTQLKQKQKLQSLF